MSGEGAGRTGDDAIGRTGDDAIGGADDRDNKRARGERIHVRQINKVEVKEKKGNYTVLVGANIGSIVVINIDQSQKAYIDQLLAALNAARPGEIEFKY